MIFHCTASIIKTPYMGTSRNIQEVFMVEAEDELEACSTIETYYNKRNHNEAYACSYWVTGIMPPRVHCL